MTTLRRRDALDDHEPRGIVGVRGVSVTIEAHRHHAEPLLVPVDLATKKAPCSPASAQVPWRNTGSWYGDYNGCTARLPDPNDPADRGDFVCTFSDERLSNRKKNQVRQSVAVLK